MVLIGCGAVGRAVLELLPLCGLVPRRHWATVLIVEPRSIAPVRPLLRGLRWRHERVALEPGKVRSVLVRLMRRGDVCIDASVNVDALAVMGVCWSLGCLYLNTSMEEWEVPDQHVLRTGAKELDGRSLHRRVQQARARFRGPGPSMLCDQGMNPGLISQLVLHALATKARRDGPASAAEAMRSGDYAEAAELLGLRMIHITERDNQRPRRSDLSAGTFRNTWSAPGLVAECLDPVQVGWGSFEPAAPPIAGSTLPASGPKNVRTFPVRGMDLSMWSYSPARVGIGGPYAGMCIPHGEANTLSHRLGSRNGAYRPTVCFVYQPCPIARAGLARMRRRGYRPSRRMHTFQLPELRSGYDAVGALLMFADGSRPWWCGTVLDVEDVRRLGIRHSGPTVIQVGISLLAALRCMLKAPRSGFLTPEDLPHEEMVRLTRPWLGRVECGPAPPCVRVPPDPTMRSFMLRRS